uniref:hypothetical protein n=1 Tax=Planococcus sp. CAU13 TaxID=1541197 RepID=UPI00052FF4C1
DELLLDPEQPVKMAKAVNKAACMAYFLRPNGFPPLTTAFALVRPPAPLVSVAEYFKADETHSRQKRASLNSASLK